MCIICIRVYFITLLTPNICSCEFLPEILLDFKQVSEVTLTMSHVYPRVPLSQLHPTVKKNN